MKHAWLVTLFVVLSGASVGAERIPEYAEEQCRRKGGTYRNGDCDVPRDETAEWCKKKHGEYRNGTCFYRPDNWADLCRKRGGAPMGDGHCLIAH
jgi:hypothetical protein